MNAPAVTAPPVNGKRGRIIASILGVFAVAGIAYGLYWYFVSRYYESTDDAYVSANLVQVTPQTNGTVVTIGADDTDFVKAGHALVELDRADARIALDQAESQLAKAVRGARNLFATAAQLKATVEMHRAELQRAQDDYAGRQRLAASGAVSGEDVRHAREALAGAKAALQAAEHQAAATGALVDGTDINRHPDVLNAAAHLREAYLAYARTVVPAPVTGYVARRNVQLGQRVSPGVVLMAVVPLDQVWVDANFKEVQLADMRAGQPVTVKADLYGDAVTYHGKVQGFGAGTGGAFALLPAQNATGNWVKVVQRVPVRIALDPAEIAAHPLQVGLSATVKVDISESGNGKDARLSQAARTTPAATTHVFDSLETEADARVAAIITANAGGAPTKAAP